MKIISTEDLFGTAAAAKLLTNVADFDTQILVPLGVNQAMFYVDFDPASNGDVLTMNLQALKPGGTLSNNDHWGDLVVGSIAGGVETIKSWTKEYTALSGDEILFNFPVAMAYRAIRIGVKDDANSTGKAYIRAEFGTDFFAR